MKLKCIKDSKWQLKDGSIKSFVEGQKLEVGEDVTDEIAEDMLRCEYAVPCRMPNIETKPLGKSPVIETKQEDNPSERKLKQRRSKK
jgi:hypothetical protein